MMQWIDWDGTRALQDLAWPSILLLAWLAGVYCKNHLKIPAISTYAIVGFIWAPIQSKYLNSAVDAGPLLLAHIALGLILFESGYLLNLRWLRLNPWIAVTSFVESMAVFVSVLLFARWCALGPTVSLWLAALAIASSPEAISGLIAEQGSRGQVTERALHLSVLNCILALLFSNTVLGAYLLENAMSLWQVGYQSVLVLIASAGLGGMFGLALPQVQKVLGPRPQDNTLASAIALVFLVALTHSSRLSPELAALVFGVVARSRRSPVSPPQHGFGTLGEILRVQLFVCIAAQLRWAAMLDGALIGLGLVAVRQAARVAGVTLLAHVSGVSWRQGLWVGLAMSPLSAFAVLMLEQTRVLGLDWHAMLSPLVAAVFLLAVIGPLLTQWALRQAHELPQSQRHAA